MASNPPPPHGQGPVPEILPPETSGPNGYPGYHLEGYTVSPPPPPPAARPHRRFATAPATWTLLGVNVGVYLLTLLAGGTIASPGDAVLERFAVHAGAILIDHEWWRIVTGMFLHGGLLHLALNMWCLWNLGMLAEPLMGSLGVVAAFLLTGASGNLLSTLISWEKYGTGNFFNGPVSVGASGAVFGIAGALIVLLKSSRLPVPPEELHKLRRSVILFAVINLVIGFGINAGTNAFGAGVHVDNMAHLGGCVGGLLFAAPLVPRIGSPRRTFDVRLRASVALMVGALMLFGFFIAQFR